MRFVLNEGVRFDAPGTYRLYILDRRDEQLGSGVSPRPPLVSNIITLQIVGRDPHEDEQTASLARLVLHPSAPSSGRAWAVRALKFLGSSFAIDEMARRLFRDSSHDAEDAEFVEGLLGAADRERAIRSTTTQLDDLDRPVPRTFLATAAALKLTRDTAGPLTAAQKYAAYTEAADRRRRALDRVGRPAALLQSQARAGDAVAMQILSEEAHRKTRRPGLPPRPS
jgi:hypothetical protein